MKPSPQQMTPREFAELQTRLGTRVVHSNGWFWRQVRPFFYRPLVPLEEIGNGDVPPPSVWAAGYQYIVVDEHDANSHMAFVVDDPGPYSLDSVGHKRRNLIKRAAQRFRLRQIDDLQQLKDQGYEVYMSFHRRTQYAYMSQRTKKPIFDRWAETLFGNGQAIILGAFAESRLFAVSCAYWVGSTLINATVFSETGAMKRDVGELLLHELRQIATAEPRIRQVLLRTYKGGDSQDQYYLCRGARVIRKPARLQMSKPLHPLLRWCLPRQYELLVGGVAANGNGGAVRGPGGLETAVPHPVHLNSTVQQKSTAESCRSAPVSAAGLMEPNATYDAQAKTV